MTIDRTITVVLLAALAILWLAAPAAAAGEAYGSLNGDWPWHVQGLLTHAATKSLKWSSQRAAVERHIEHIGFLLRSAELASRTGDHAVAGINVRHALESLELGILRGFYSRNDIEPLRLIIARQLPDHVRHDTKSLPREGR